MGPDNGIDPLELKFISVFGFSGGNIYSFKKTKSLFTMLQTDYSFFDEFSWDRDFFGPYTEELTQKLSEVQADLWLRVYEQQIGRAKHFSYELSSIGKKKFQSDFERMLDILKESNIDDTRKFVLTCLSWNSLPCNYIFNEVLRKHAASRKPAEGAENGLDTPSTQIWWRPDIQFSKDDIERVIRVYRAKKISLSPANLNNGHSYRVRVDPDRPKKMYEYLCPRSIEKKEDFAEFGQVKFVLEKLDISRDELNQAKDDIKRKFIEESEYYDHAFESYMEKLKNFWQKAGGCSEGITLGFDKYGSIETTIHPDLKNEISGDWNLGYLNHVFHILRPFEYYNTPIRLEGS